MKYLFLLLLVGCASQPIYKPYNYNGALDEIYRNGSINSGEVPYGGENYMVPRVCVSTPIYALGRYVRTDVICQ